MDANADQSKRDFRRKLVRISLLLLRKSENLTSFVHQIYFRSQPAQRVQPGECRIIVRRDYLFEDAFSEIMRQPEDVLRKRLMITFKGEEGIDFGGVSR